MTIKSLIRNILIVSALLVVFTSASFSDDKPYEIRKYDLSIKADLGSKRVTVNAIITIKNPDLREEFEFGLNDRYDSVLVTSDASPVVVQRESGSITVTIKKPSEDVTFRFTLSGILGRSDGADRDIVTDSSLFLLWSDRFYPIDFDHWTRVRTSLTVPSGFQAIAPGKLMESRSSGSNIEYVFETSNPTLCFSVFADSRWIKTVRVVNGISMQTLLYPQSQKFSGQIFSTSSEILKFYSDTYCAYPFDQFSFVTIADMDARRAFPGFVGYEPRYLEKEFTSTGHDAHETALLWWFYTIRGTGPGSFQWTEGFGDYAEILYDEQFQKPLPKILEFFRSQYLEAQPGQDMLFSQLRGNTPQKFIHGRYPWLMHLVRYVVGDSAFKEAMKLLFQRFRFRTFSIEEFVATMEEGCKQSLQWWTDEWLGRKGVPSILLASSTQPINGGFRTTVLMAQEGNLYHLPVELGIVTAKGVRIERVSLTEREAKFTFESLDKPTDVLLDPRGQILMKRSSGLSKGQ